MTLKDSRWRLAILSPAAANSILCDPFLLQLALPHFSTFPDCRPQHSNTNITKGFPACAETMVKMSAVVQTFTSTCFQSTSLVASCWRAYPRCCLAYTRLPSPPGEVAHLVTLGADLFTKKPKCSVAFKVAIFFRGAGKMQNKQELKLKTK